MSSLVTRPARLFGLLASAEMVTWTLLLLGMLGKYVLELGQWGVRVGGGLHGLVFLSYCLVTVLVGVDQRWRLGQVVMGLGSAVLPYLTVPFERYAVRHGLLGDQWRLRATGPQSAAERVTATAVRNPALAAVAGMVAVLTAFSVLLMLGPPTQWFA